ncbi:hypothetical protein MNEG_13775 [Monoraphidium neglectum]|uniref:Uncharacterized protein n=1 Tax=Monoraphidium neglectum TaxID=145388 RepID=A0A0D2J2L3_9CHLO|nr:hypothetical protein MNEG_13775 [Monoraphidium neglectum]KIY94187.1 hypothetical protein MNEG_13775 [Monoraphidium neglectum]|eukprot:XP_013893207.1 hypothetical protein MNEG_13775 [Monoraphidium neglectum]
MTAAPPAAAASQRQFSSSAAAQPLTAGGGPPQQQAQQKQAPRKKQQRAPDPQPSQRSLRGKATNEYNRERAAWRRQVGALRRQWHEEHQAARRGAADAAARDARERRALADLRASQKQEDSGHGPMLRDLRAAERELEAAERRLRMAYRTRIRERILERYKQQRYEELLGRSRHWIAREALEDRVRQAVENPVSM